MFGYGVAVAGTLTLSLGVGLYYACAGKKQTNEDMLVGGRNMSPVPIAYERILKIGKFMI